jgi:hypothetical protein
MDLIERLRERAEFEDKRVLDEANAMGFVPEVYTGSQTGALLLEAAAALEAARGERDELAKDAAKYRWGINNARWIRSEQKAYVAIPVAPDTDLSCIAMRDAAIDAAMEGEKGQ